MEQGPRDPVFLAGPRDTKNIRFLRPCFFFALVARSCLGPSVVLFLRRNGRAVGVGRSMVGRGVGLGIVGPQGNGTIPRSIPATSVYGQMHQWDVSQVKDTSCLFNAGSTEF